jgi:hypothetical protein
MLNLIDEFCDHLVKESKKELLTVKTKCENETNEMSTVAGGMGGTPSIAGYTLPVGLSNNNYTRTRRKTKRKTRRKTRRKKA